MHGALEEADCPLCGGGERQVVHAFPPYAVVRCAACAFQYLSPRLTEAEMRRRYESATYFEGGDVGYASYADQEPALRATFRAVARELVRRGLGGGHLLEVGAGYGFLLEEAAAAFRSVRGTELAESAAAAARARGLDVVTGGLADLDPAARFDAIVGGHVLEHVYDPVDFVGRLRDRLRPGGALVLGTPDAGSAWRRVLGARWPSFKVPEHVLYFDRPALERVFRAAGLVDVGPFRYRHAFPLGLVLGKAGLAGIGWRSGRLGRTPVWLPATTIAAVGRRPAEAGP